MQYFKRFVVSMAHYNGGEAYENARLAYKAIEECDFSVAFGHLLRAAHTDLHGHNLVIEIQVAVEDELGTPWVIDDEKLTELVMEWSDQNLSTHNDFRGIRATTENMAKVMADKIAMLVDEATITVKVLETPDISAQYTRHTK